MKPERIWRNGIGKRWRDSGGSGVQSTNFSWAFLLEKRTQLKLVL